MKNALFVASVILATTGFLLASTDHIPFLLRVFSPKYAEAKEATEVLRNGGSLTKGQAGFEILAEIAMKGLSEIESNSPEALADIRVLSFKSARKPGIAFGDRGTYESFPVEVNLSNGKNGEINLVVMEKIVADLREGNVFWWGAGLFSLGIVLLFIGHFYKPRTTG